MKEISYNIKPIKREWLPMQYAVIKTINDYGKEEHECLTVLDTEDAAVHFANEMYKAMGIPTRLKEPGGKDHSERIMRWCHDYYVQNNVPPSFNEVEEAFKKEIKDAKGEDEIEIECYDGTLCKIRIR